MKILSRRAVKHLRASAILNALPDGAYITDVDRNILFWSAAARRITGWTDTEVAGHSCNDNILVHVDKDGHELCGKDMCPLHRSIVTGLPSKEPLLVYAKHRSGERIPVEVSVAPLRDSKGRVVGGIELFRDLTASMKDLERAHLIQASAMESHPDSDPRLAVSIRYTPNDLVGGDFYHMEHLYPDLIGVMIADVMGHGVASALYTMQLRSLWEDWREEAGNPARFVTHISRQLHVLAEDAGYFATAICMTINPATGELDFVRAGHPAPLHVGLDGRASSVGTVQMALGMVEDAVYTCEHLTLAHGETILLYTDGAIEIINDKDVELGEAGLIDLLSRKEVLCDGIPRLDLLEEKLLAYSAGIRLADDLTLLAITRR
jgi:PAS domain S-box-containing protein